MVKIRKTTNLENLIVTSLYSVFQQIFFFFLSYYVKSKLFYILQVVLPSAKSVAEIRPDFGAIEKCPGGGIIVTGIAPPESEFDFHSRFFAPKWGINEVNRLACLSF